MPPQPEPQPPPLSRYLATHRTVCIYGGGPSLRLAPFKRRETKWSVGSLWPVLSNRIDLYFCLHDTDPIHQLSKLEDVGYIDRVKYPLDKIIKRYDSRYFTNSISYMIALAIYRSYKTIKIYGVDLDQSGEWAFERPSVAYWCGMAKGKGITVIWDKLDPIYLYAYQGEEMKSILSVLAEKRGQALAELQAATDPKVQDQWRGFIYAIDQIEKEVKS